MKVNFDDALREVLKHEGGYVNHPEDPGGETNYGITRAVYDSYRRVKSLPTQSIRRITQAEVAEIYREQYWDAVDGDYLPSGVDFAVFDFAVNSGVGRASRFLQQILGVTVDGNIGPKTVEAAQKMDAELLINALCDRRMAFLCSLNTFKTFGKGWTRRVSEVRALALEMAKASPSEIPNNSPLPESPTVREIETVAPPARRSMWRALLDWFRNWRTA